MDALIVLIIIGDVIMTQLKLICLYELSSYVEEKTVRLAYKTFILVSMVKLFRELCIDYIFEVGLVKTTIFGKCQLRKKVFANLSTRYAHQFNLN